MPEGQRTVSFRCSALIDALTDVEEGFMQVAGSEGFLLVRFKSFRRLG